MDESPAILPGKLSAQPPRLGLSGIPERRNLRDFTDRDWDNQRENISRLYLEEKRPLKEVKTLIESQYGLRARYVTSPSAPQSLTCGCQTRMLDISDAF